MRSRKTSVLTAQEMLLKYGVTVLKHPKRSIIATDVLNFMQLTNIVVEVHYTSNGRYLVMFSIDLLPIEVLRKISELPDSKGEVVANRLALWYRLKDLLIV